MAVAAAVALYFVVNPLHARVYNPENIWFYLDILMAVGAVLAVAFNTNRKFAHRSVEGVPRQYWVTNILFYAALATSILLLHSWFATLALGLEVSDHQGFVKWAAVIVSLPLVFGATGAAMWRRA